MSLPHGDVGCSVVCGPQAIRHLIGVSLAIIQGIRTSIAKKPYIFYDFSEEIGGGGGADSMSATYGSAHVRSAFVTFPG